MSKIKLLKLQKQYRSGEIKEEELTQEQVNSLCALYDKQIANLKKSNEIRKQKLCELFYLCSCLSTQFLYRTVAKATFNVKENIKDNIKIFFILFDIRKNIYTLNY